MDSQSDENIESREVETHFEFDDGVEDVTMCGFIAQLVEHHTGIAEVTGSNPVEALIFFRLLYSRCLNWKFTAKITYHLHNGIIINMNLKSLSYSWETISPRQVKVARLDFLGATPLKFEN